MHLKISHTTEYHYDEPVQYALQRLRLTPITGVGQTVLGWQTLVDGAVMEVSYDDHFGNRVHLVSVDGDREAIRITASGEVHTEDRHGVLGPHQSYVPLWLYARETPLTKGGKLIRDLAKSAEGDTDLARMHALMAMIHEAVEYKAGETHAETAAEDALEAGHGVCQDHAHILISAARSLDMPARYISGYLMMEGQTEQTASHAWAEIHLPGLGWVGFDAANKICPDDRYVRIASGLCYRDAAPISGLIHGEANETLKVSVTVEQQAQSQSQTQSQ
ncbi:MULTISPECIES: transglutaminase family protein [Ensifer]|jgi:transglutaminase-like putative cysteine protease|uniref:Transglutaminase family protein n=1 Tax=Ensifer canadensis TaxID=555315 RepID=A0AAW4FKS9_9HYPH|nr:MULTISPECIES: transglutaminase family protein [Ensifer]AHK45140.1 transglutaminase-like superfamily protein [Ensifer adhaerens OV14]MDP9630142.1 transglutaminase-like putative cysteine protease [Ensifer adhaerens]KQU94504.1 transglutaminase [Ensifer sp. Root31]KQW56009.1 transglutaminase [Ensifer sp. Root1252]KQW83411.1 transglutaminase [Ensifer sp. Root127]